MKRIGMAFVGVAFAGFSVGALQKADFGADPFTCFATGIANIFHSQYSIFFTILTAILLVGVFILERHYIGVATIFNLFGIGVAADIMHGLLDALIPEPSMMIRICILLGGLLVLCFASSLYFTADLGVSGYDAVSLIAANKYKVAAFKYCRITTDLICVIVGFVFHVTVGIGTVITALFMGPVVQFFNTHVSEPFLYSSHVSETAENQK